MFYIYKGKNVACVLKDLLVCFFGLSTAAFLDSEPSGEKFHSLGEKFTSSAERYGVQGKSFHLFLTANTPK